jgi:hypothetical protein
MAISKKANVKTSKKTASSAAPAASKAAGRTASPQSAKVKPAGAKAAMARGAKEAKSVVKQRPSTPRGADPLSQKETDQARALSEARKQIQLLIEDRDNQVAMAEAAEMERDSLERDLTEARERIADLEKQISEGTSSGGSQEPESEEGSLAFEEEEEEEEEESTGNDDLDDVESIYDRMDDPRVRRQELDRERLNRESEAGDEPYWRVCPKCGDSIDEVESEDVKIDRCETCGGIFLDHGEVEMLLSIARGQHGLRRVRNALQI